MKKLLSLLIALCFAAGVFAQQAIDYRWGAEQGEPMDQFNLGKCYYYGSGVLQDPIFAAYWFSKAAEQGHAEAQFYLGACYYTGDGVPKNFSHAEYWVRKAAVQGLARAQCLLAVYYFEGSGVSKDPVQTIHWLYKAADQGYVVAQSFLAGCYLDGTGVPKDGHTALFWLETALQNDDGSEPESLMNDVKLKINELSAVGYSSLLADHTVPSLSTPTTLAATPTTLVAASSSTNYEKDIILSSPKVSYTYSDHPITIRTYRNPYLATSLITNPPTPRTTTPAYTRSQPATAPLNRTLPQVTSKSPSAPVQIAKVWLVYDENRGEKSGMEVHVKFLIQGFAHKVCKTNAWFYFSSEQFAVGKSFTPAYDNLLYDDFVLFMPYATFSGIDQGDHELMVRVGIFDEETQLAESDFFKFSLTWSE